MRLRVFGSLLVFCWAASPAGGTAYNDVLPSARSMGMGSAFAAIADDAFGPYYNPAGSANTPFVQAGGSFGRMFSPKGALFFASGVYLRPYEPINTATVGAGYALIRQRNGGNVDAISFNYAQEYKVNQIPLSRPLKIGGNFKVVSSSDGDGSKSKLGLGFDAGVLARTNMGFSAAVVLNDLVTSLSYPRPGITLATAYTWRRWLTFAGDLRVRGGLAEFYPGIEATFQQGLLKLRAGKGLRLDGVGTAAVGAGINLSPMSLDVAMSFPTSSLNRNAGGVQANFSYRFGAPSYVGQFIGQAAVRAETLRTDLSELEDRKRTLTQQATKADTDKAVALNELKALQQRLFESQERYRALLRKNDELDYRAAEKAAGLAPKPVPPPKPKPVPPPAWPKKHVVKTGDTLRAMAKEYYGDPNRWESIFDANRDKVDRGLPIVGETLTIPAPQ